MYVTNLTKSRLGINGIINLAPEEVNRYIPDTPDLISRVSNLERAQLVSVVRESGKTKTDIPGKIVKTVGVDTGALSTGPRTEKATEAKPVETPAPQKANKAKAAEVEVEPKTAEVDGEPKAASPKVEKNTKAKTPAKE